MNSKLKKLKNSVFEALTLLIKNDKEIIDNSVKEECINHKLAQYLEYVLREKKLLSKYVVDIEYNKYKEDEKKSSDGRNIRPDIIVHKRKSGSKNNLIVIEAKKNSILKDDRKKVEDLVSSGRYSYSLGVTISYSPKKDYMKIKFLTFTNNWEAYKLDKSKLSWFRVQP